MGKGIFQRKMTRNVSALQGYIDAQGALLEIADICAAVVDFGGSTFIKETFLSAPVGS